VFVFNISKHLYFYVLYIFKKPKPKVIFFQDIMIQTVLILGGFIGDMYQIEFCDSSAITRIRDMSWDSSFYPCFIIFLSSVVFCGVCKISE